jgi:hypothetical protein
MDTLQEFAKSLGAFAPFAALAWWIIRGQAKTIERKDARIDQLTNALFQLTQSSEKTTAVALGVALKPGG